MQMHLPQGTQLLSEEETVSSWFVQSARAPLRKHDRAVIIIDFFHSSLESMCISLSAYGNAGLTRHDFVTTLSIPG